MEPGEFRVALRQGERAEGKPEGEVVEGVWVGRCGDGGVRNGDLKWVGHGREGWESMAWRNGINGGKVVWSVNLNEV